MMGYFSYFVFVQVGRRLWGANTIAKRLDRLLKPLLAEEEAPAANPVGVFMEWAKWALDLRL